MLLLTRVRLQALPLKAEERSVSAYLKAGRGWAAQLRKNPLAINNDDVVSLVRLYAESTANPALLTG